MQRELRPSDLPPTAALAYLGDAVHSLFMRERAVAAGLIHSEELHRYVTATVNAAAQARILEALTPHLSEEELALCRRASNSKHLQHPKHMSALEYRRATGFEALLGMLYLLGREERLRELLTLSCEASKKEETNDTEN